MAKRISCATVLALCLAATANANPPNHTRGVPLLMRSRVFFCAGVTKNDVPCCFTSTLNAAVCTGDDFR